MEFIPIDGYTNLYYNLDESSVATYASNLGTAGALNLTKYDTSYFGVGGILNKCLACYNGYLQSVATSIGEPTGNNWTVSLWIFPFQYYTNGVMFQKHYNLNNAWTSPFSSIYIGWNGSPNNVLQCAVAISGVFTNVISDIVLPLYEWTLVTLTYDGITIKLYQNNILVKSRAASGTTDYGTHGSWSIGKANNYQYYGYIDDVRVESTVRDINYIAEMYDRGIGNFDNYATTYFYTKQETNTILDGYAKITDLVPKYITDSSILARWKLNEQTGSTIYDSGSDGYNLTTVNSPTLGRTARLCSSVQFAATKAIEGANTLNPNPTGFSVSAWFRPMGATGTTQYIVMKGYDSSWGSTHYTSFSIYISSESHGIRAAVDLGSGEVLTDLISLLSLTYTGGSLWYHVGVTFDGSNLRLYLDGELVTTKAASGSVDWGTSQKWVIGNNHIRGASDRYFNGRVEDVVIYNEVKNERFFRDVYMGAFSNLPVRE